MVRSGVEYATDQITIYRSCPFACRYCYVWRNPLFASRVVRGSYDPIAEAEKYRRRSGRVIMVSFVSDPYPPEEEVLGKTRAVLEVLAKTDNTVLVLTKNPLTALIRDADLFIKGGFWLGTTISVFSGCYAGGLFMRKWFLLDVEGTTREAPIYSCLDVFAKDYEPLAPTPLERITVLKQAHRLGIRTFVSLEPIIPILNTDGSPHDWVTHFLNMTKKFVDVYILGSLNYPKVIKELGIKKETLIHYYREVIPKVVKQLRINGIRFCIKKELRRILGEKEGECNPRIFTLPIRRPE